MIPLSANCRALILSGCSLLFPIFLSGCASSGSAEKSMVYQPYERYGGSGFHKIGTGYFQEQKNQHGVPLWLVGFAGDNALIKNRFVAYSHSFRRAAEIARLRGATHIMLMDKNEWGERIQSSRPSSYSFSGSVTEGGAVYGSLKPNYRGGGDLDYTRLSRKYGGDISYLIFRIESPDCSLSECRNLDVRSDHVFDIFYNVWYPVDQIERKYGRASRVYSK